MRASFALRDSADRAASDAAKRAVAFFAAAASFFADAPRRGISSHLRAVLLGGLLASSARVARDAHTRRVAGQSLLGGLLAQQGARRGVEGQGGNARRLDHGRGRGALGVGAAGAATLPFSACPSRGEIPRPGDELGSEHGGEGARRAP